MRVSGDDIFIQLKANQHSSQNIAAINAVTYIFPQSFHKGKSVWDALLFKVIRLFEAFCDTFRKENLSLSINASTPVPFLFTGHYVTGSCSACLSETMSNNSTPLITDRMLTCVQCGQLFVFSEAEQKRFTKMGFDDPKRCPVCRRNKIKDSLLDEFAKKGRIRKYKEKGGYYNPDYE